MKALDVHLRECGIFLIIKNIPFSLAGPWMKVRIPISVMLTEEMLQKSGIQLYELVGLMDGLISDYSSIALDTICFLTDLWAMCSTDLESSRNTRGFVFENPEAYMPGEKIYNLGSEGLFFPYRSGRGSF